MPTPGELIIQNGTTLGGYDSSGQAAYFGGPPKPASTPLPIVPPTTTVSTSDPARSNYSAIEQAIAKLSGNPPAVPGMPTNSNLSESQALLAARRSELQQRRDQEIERLGKEFDSAAVSQKQGQKSETGSSSMGLARLGGFDSASGQAVLTNLQRVHEGEQQDLLNKRQAAIALAQNAYNDKDFELAQLQLQDARDAEKLIYDRQKDFINLSLQLKGEQRADLNQQYNMSRDKVADQRWAMQWANENGINAPFFLVGQTAFDSSTGEALSLEEYQTRTGQTVGAPVEKTDFSKIQRLDQAREAKFIKEAEQKAVLNMQDKYVDAGILPTDTLAQAEAKLKNSRIYQEQVRPPSRGGGGSISAQTKAQMLGAAKQKLADSRGAVDQKYDPSVYLSLRQDYAAITGETASFDNTYSAGLSASERANLGIGKAQGIDLQPNDVSSNPFQ